MLCRLHSNQLHSQDEQVIWAQHGHAQCVRNMHLLGDLGHTTLTIKKFSIIHSEITVFGHKSHSSDLPVCSLHVRTKLVIAQWIAHG